MDQKALNLGSKSEGFAREVLGPEIVRLPAFACDLALRAPLARVVRRAPLRSMLTPGGRAMSVASSNCGAFGWVTDRHGYRYSETDPNSGQAWPAMPAQWLVYARRAAAAAGFDEFEPDACLINQYRPGARMGLHQDRDEQDFTQPIVSMSFGLAAVFLVGGRRRKDPTAHVRLSHGDVIVFGGRSRMIYHGVRPVADGEHRTLGRRRINLTFRRAR